MSAKVCHLTSAHNRYDARIFHKECSSLVQSGYEVYLVVNDVQADEQKQGVHIVSTGFSPRNRIDRILNGSKAVYRKAMELDADLYHLHDPELQTIAGKLKRKGKKVVFDAHEDTENQIKDKKWIPKPLLGIVSAMYRNYAKNVLGKLDALVTVTPSLVEKLKDYNPRTVMVTNYPIVDEAYSREETEPGKRDYICFAGGIEEQWMHDVILRALEPLDSVKYVLAGSADEAYLARLRAMDGWKKVDFLGSVPHERVREIYRYALAGMAVNDCAQLRGIGGTLGNTKLFECMEAAVPVICTDYPLWKEVVEGNHCGICVDPRDPAAVENAVRYLLEHPQEARQMGENGRRAVEEKYNWTLEAGKLIGLYRELFSAP